MMGDGLATDRPPGGSASGRVEQGRVRDGPTGNLLAHAAGPPSIGGGRDAMSTISTTPARVPTADAVLRGRRSFIPAPRDPAIQFAMHPARSLSLSLPQTSPAPPSSLGPFQFTLKPPCLTGRYVSHSTPPLASRPARWADLGPNLSWPIFCGDGHSRPSCAPPPPAPRSNTPISYCMPVGARGARSARRRRPSDHAPLPHSFSTHSPARRHDSSSTRVSVIWASCPRSAPSAAGVR